MLVSIAFLCGATAQAAFGRAGPLGCFEYSIDNKPGRKVVQKPSRVKMVKLEERFEDGSGMGAVVFSLDVMLVHTFPVHVPDPGESWFFGELLVTFQESGTLLALPLKSFRVSNNFYAAFHGVGPWIMSQTAGIMTALFSRNKGLEPKIDSILAQMGDKVNSLEPKFKEDLQKREKMLQRGY